MNVATEVLEGICVVRVSGEVDMSNTAAIEHTVDTRVSNQAHAMVLDLSAVTYLDSSGIRMLYHLESRLTMHQQRLVIVVPPRAVIFRTLQAAGVIGSLVLVSSIDAALVVAQAGERQEHGPNGTTG